MIHPFSASASLRKIAASAVSFRGMYDQVSEICKIIKLQVDFEQNFVRRDRKKKRAYIFSTSEWFGSTTLEQGLLKVGKFPCT